MYADPHALLRHADDLRARGDHARRLARAIAREAAAVDWHGTCAEAMRHATRLGCSSLLRLADEHDRVADLLTAHAHRVADRLGVALGVLHWLEDVA